MKINKYIDIGTIETINKESGETFADKTYNFLLDMGISSQTLDAILNIMIEKV